MFCSKCGSQIPDGVAACPNCGEQFEQFSNSQAQQPHQPQGSFQSQTVRQSVSQAKLGVSCGVLAALLCFAGAFGWGTVFALIAGYIFLFESDQWLRSYTAKMTKIFVIYNVISFSISLLKSCLSVLVDLDIFSNKLVDGIYKLSNGLSMINSITGIVFMVILLMNAIKAYNMRRN